MQVSVLTLRYDPTRGVLDDSCLAAFARDKVILGVRDHFFLVGSVPHLSLVIEYRLPPPGSNGGAEASQSITKPRWRPTI